MPATVSAMISYTTDDPSSVQGQVDTWGLPPGANVIVTVQEIVQQGVVDDSGAVVDNVPPAAPEPEPRGA